MTMILSAVVILAMCWALVKKYETRLVLIAGGLILACMAGDPLAPLVSFSKSMKQANVFEVIIASMGFAAVVKMTGLHTHLIAVFLKLLKKAGRRIARDDHREQRHPVCGWYVRRCGYDLHSAASFCRCSSAARGRGCDGRPLWR